MANISQTFSEGASINRPPLFSGDNYPFWKIRMKIFLESVDKGVWDAIVNGPFIPTKIEEGKAIPKDFLSWTPDENKRAHYDVRAKNIISSALTLDEFYRVSICQSAKEMWDVLEVTHEGTDEVKRARKNTLVQEYEMFRMKAEETIYDVQKRFTHIVNHLIALGKVFEKEELNIKILKSLNRAWQPKVTSISESRDLTTMSMATLFGKLREHELELGRLKEEEEGEKRQSIALKAAAKTDGRSKTKDKETAAEKEDEASDSEALNLMVKRFSKFLKYKNKSTGKSVAGNRRFSSKKQESSSSVPTCYECGKSGHIKPECPILKIKKKLEEKNEATSKSKRVKKAYIAWEDNDSSTSSDSSESNEEETNLCLMADTKSSDSSVSDLDLESIDESYETRFYQLLDVYNELHEEARKLQYANNRHKGENRWLENRLKQLETEMKN
ncbi:uncharacterized protein LOC114188805 [Vigna unguiculata]|uniref:uncharacterized protein LOC114188805 n=1 Tax=Vigna unguiculata TaxID=3917 RepID=UPI0010172201|nr:uncharacterized protein LOC114188805 [Vigna unguiculata]